MRLHPPSLIQRLPAWLVLPLVLLLCAPPMLVGVNRGGPDAWMEGISLMSAQETWLRLHDGDTSAWLIPSYNGQPRIRKPPGLIWTNLVAWADLTPETSTPKQLIARARIVSALLGFLVVASVFWMGCTIGDRTLGVLAALIAGTMQLLQIQARLASYDIHLVAWSSLAIAGGLWALRPFGAPPRAGPLLLGWAVTIFGLAMASLSKGPLAIMVITVALLIVIAFSRGRRIRGLVQLLLAVLIGLIPLGLWELHVLNEIPGARERLHVEFSGLSTNRQRVFFYPQRLLGLILPWTLWWLAGLAHPFTAAKDDERRPCLFSWVWFIALLLIYSINAGKAARYILPIVPCTALVIAWVWRHHIRMASSGTRDEAAGWLYWPHWLALAMASVALWIPLSGHDWIGASSWFDNRHLAPIGDLAAGALCAVLLGIALTGLWLHRRWRPGAAAITAVIWAVVATTAYWSGLARSPHELDPYVRDAGRLLDVIGDRELYYLQTRDMSRPDNEFIIYLRRIVEQVKPDDLAEFALTADRPCYLVADDLDSAAAWLGAVGFEPVLDFHDEPGRARKLWVLPKPVPEDDP